MTRSTKKRMPTKRLVLACIAAGVLSGCTAERHQDLRDYINKIKAQPPGHIAPLPEFETYETFTYQAMDLRDPFEPEKEAMLSEAANAPDNGIRPDINRKPEALEAFPLDSLAFIGTLQKDNLFWAILKAPDGMVYRALVGNHAGKNYGEITSISETKIQLVEIVPDGRGGWFKRDAAIALKE